MNLQSEIILPELIPFNNNGKWGYCNKEKKIVIDCIYEDVKPFVGDVAIVKVEEKFFYINQKGEDVLGIRFDKIFPFSEGLSAAVLNNKVGFVNNKAKIIIPLDYLYLDDNGRNNDCDLVFKKGLVKVRNKTNDEIVYGFINQKGEIVIPFDYSYISDFSDGLAFALESDKLLFEYLEQCASATGCDFNKLKNNCTKEIFLLDINNKRYFFTGGFVSNEVSLFKENMSIISASYGEHNLYSYINQEGKRVHPFYNFVRPFYEGLAYVSFLEEYYSLNNILSGYESVNQKKYDVLGIQHANFVDKSGFEVSKIRFERAYNFKDGFAAVQLDGKWGFLSKTGELAIPCIFDEVKSFSNEFAAARKDNLWGFINILGEVKIDFIYQNVSSFDNNHCCVQIENEWMIIDKKLNKICFSGNLEVDFINTFEYYAIENQFYGFISIFIKEKCISFKYFFYNKNNEAIISNLIPFGGFKDNILLVRSSEYYGSKFGYIDIFGNEYFLHKKDDKNNFYEQRYYANPKDAFDDDEQYIDWYENQ